GSRDNGPGCDRRSHPGSRQWRGRLCRETLRHGRASRSDARGDPAKGGRVRPHPVQWAAFARPGDPRGRLRRSRRSPDRAGIRPAAGLFDTTGRDPVTRRAGGSHLWLGGRGRKQCGRVPDPFASQEARHWHHPEHQRRGMAGRQGRVRRSLQFRLSLWLSLTIILVAATAGFLSFSSAFDEAIELQDDQLRQTAALLQRQLLSAAPTEVAGPPGADPESRLIVLTSHPHEGWKPEDVAPDLRPDLPDGLQTVGIRSVPWRLFVSTHDGGVRVAIGQQTTGRDEIANKSALRTVAPLLSLVLLLPLLVGYLIRKMLQPLKIMAAELESRSEPVWQEIAAGG